jgi:hypothetical protein
MRRPPNLPVALLLSLLIVPATAAPAAAAAAKTALSPRHQMLLAAAADLAARVADRVWPGWSGTGMEVLLIAGERELLLGGERHPEGFDEVAEVAGVGAVWSRRRALPPTLLATMPLFGPPPTIVVGTPEATERGGTAWLQVLLHEHFHQWQMRDPGYYAATAGLDLAAGDTTGRWMLEYPFPYDEPEIGRQWAASSRALAGLLGQSADQDLTAGATAFWRGFARLVRSLAPPDARYLNFQLWQEGVARFVELRVAEEAAARWQPPAALVAENGYESFDSLARSAREALLEDLDAPDLALQRRISFYAMGAGMALLLERTRPDWKASYELPRFRLAPATTLD